MWRLLIVILIFAMSAGDVSAAKKKRNIKTVKSEQQAAQRRIKETTRKINDNAQKTERTLNQLNLLRGEISQKEDQISTTRMQLDSIGKDITMAQDSLSALENRLVSLKTTYIAALRKLQGTQQFTNQLAYIFASESFSKALARIRYVRSFSKWRKRKAEEIKQTAEALKSQKNYLSELHSQRSSSLNTLSNDQSMLEAKKEETGRMVASLKSDGANLKKALEKEKRRLRNIDSEITRMIEAERRERERQQGGDKASGSKAKGKGKSSGSKGSSSSGKSASGGKSASKSPAIKSQINDSDPDAVMTRHFASAKGSMMFPVSGPYRIVSRFGSTSDQPYNTGIEIVLDGSANARAVFEGTVSRIFQNHDGNYSVMVRHGAYITVFYNIGSLSVKNNGKVKAGQTIGRVAVDPRYGKPMLHFEVRKGTQTLNPQSWVR